MDYGHKAYRISTLNHYTADGFWLGFEQIGHQPNRMLQEITDFGFSTHDKPGILLHRQSIDFKRRRSLRCSNDVNWTKPYSALKTPLNQPEPGPPVCMFNHNAYFMG
jgi:hypothetical protein